MERALERVRVKVKEGASGGVTIRIGATGKVSALMMQEIDSNIKTLKKPAIESRRIQTAPVSINCGSLRNTRITPRKKKNMKQNSQQIPMLDSEDLWIDKTPIRGKEPKKVAQRIVETVDLKCGENDGDWSVIPIEKA